MRDTAGTSRVQRACCTKACDSLALRNLLNSPPLITRRCGAVDSRFDEEVDFSLAHNFLSVHLAGEGPLTDADNKFACHGVGAQEFSSDLFT
mmetsp:Transcript_46686/g.123895  ORF Transcript_46686/g.123895 Transcript_46686/m.123895 type:complete len:92 (+) Transcript_46686:335-610(+)